MIAIFHNRIVRAAGILLVVLALTGDAIEDVSPVPESAIAVMGSEPSDDAGGATTCCTAHCYTDAPATACTVVPAVAGASIRYLIADDAIPPGLPVGIDHPPQLS